MSTDKIILGIDPGTAVTGYGIIHIKGRDIKLLGAGIITLQKIKEHPLKLKRIFEASLELIELYKPDELAIEAPFFGKNVQSMLKLGRAQGIAMAAALVREVPIFEYSPKKIKHSITGNGNASKEQVAAMLKKILLIKTLPHYLDATDALGAALCHHFQQSSSITATTARSEKNTSLAIKHKPFSSWKSFLSANPERVNKKK